MFRELQYGSTNQSFAIQRKSYTTCYSEIPEGIIVRCVHKSRFFLVRGCHSFAPNRNGPKKTFQNVPRLA